MAERLTIEHYVGECVLKCAQVVLAARMPRAPGVEAPIDKRSGRWVSGARGARGAGGRGPGRVRGARGARRRHAARRRAHHRAPAASPPPSVPARR
jgi:hypothetical protein